MSAYETASQSQLEGTSFAAGGATFRGDSGPTPQLLPPTAQPALCLPPPRRPFPAPFCFLQCTAQPDAYKFDSADHEPRPSLPLSTLLRPGDVSVFQIRWRARQIVIPASLDLARPRSRSARLACTGAWRLSIGPEPPQASLFRLPR